MDEKDLKAHRLEVLKEWLSFVKFFLGTFLIALIGAWVDNTLKDRELQIKETEALGKYVDYALTTNVANRRLFAQYFATVSRNEDTRLRWQQYDSLVTLDYVEYLNKSDSLAALQKAIEEKYEKEIALLKSQRNVGANNTELNKKIALVEEKLTKVVDSISLVKSDIKAELTAIPINVPQTEKKELTLEDLKQSDLARTTVRFLKRWGDQCFTAFRIKDFGGSKKSYARLGQATEAEIDDILQALVRLGIAERGTCSNPTLVSFNEETPDTSWADK